MSEFDKFDAGVRKILSVSRPATTQFSLLTALLMLTLISTLYAQSLPSRVQPYGFHGVYLGMSLAEFKTKYPAPGKDWGGGGVPFGRSMCTSNMKADKTGNRVNIAKETMTLCTYMEAFVYNKSIQPSIPPNSEADRFLARYPQVSIPLDVSVRFFDGKLVMIEIETGFGTAGCFYSQCEGYLPLYQVLTENLGTPTRVGSEKPVPLYAMRWENDSSVAEFQYYMCGPWDGTDRGWVKAISEILEGHYCGRDDDMNGGRAAMFYLHKELSRALAMRLGNSEN